MAETVAEIRQNQARLVKREDNLDRKLEKLTERETKLDRREGEAKRIERELEAAGEALDKGKLEVKERLREVLLFLTRRQPDLQNRMPRH